MLTPVATIVSQLRALKPFPDQQIVVTAIAGPTTPYTVTWRNPTLTDTGPWPASTHSCTATDGHVADPGDPRSRDFVQRFGDNGRRAVGLLGQLGIGASTGSRWC